MGPAGLAVTNLTVGPAGTVTTTGNLNATDMDLGGTVTISDADIATTGGKLKLGGTVNASGTVNVTGDTQISGKPNLNVTGGHLKIDVPVGGSFPTGVQLHLDAGALGLANGDVVNSWPDQSGLGRHADNREGDPNYLTGALNGQPVVDFDGNDFLYTTHNFEADLGNPMAYTILTVSRYTGGDHERVISSKGRNWLFGYHGNLDERWHADGWIHTTGSGNTDWHLHAGTMTDESDPKAAFWKDGVLLTSNDNGSNNNTNGIAQLSLGAWQNAGNESSTCQVAEVLIFDRVLTADELNDVGGYLNDKYNLGFAGYTGGLGAPSFGNLTMAAGSQLSLNSDGSGEASFAGITAGNGATIHGKVIAKGDVAVGGSVGTLNIDGGYTQAGGSNYKWEADSGGSDTIAVTGNLDVSAAWNLEVTPLHHNAAMNGQTLMSSTGAITGPPAATVTLADNVYADLYNVGGATVSQSGPNIVLNGVAQNPMTVSNAGGAWATSGSWDNGVPDTSKAAVVAGGTVDSTGGTAKDLVVAGGNLNVNANTLAVNNNVRIGAGSELKVDGAGTWVTVGNEAKVYDGGTLHLSNGGALGSSVKVLGGGTLKTSGTMAMPDNVEFDPKGNLHVAGGTLTIGGGGASVLLQDNFNDNSIDPAKWNVVLSGIPDGPSVTETGGEIRLTSRGHLNTVQQFDPALGGLKITGTWEFGSDDFIQVLTRSDGTPGGGYGETNNGIEVYAHTGSNQLQIRGKGGATVTGAVNGVFSGNVGNGTTYYFEFTDDGTNLSATLTEVGNPAKTATATATSTSVMGSNLVVFHNRENGRTSFLDDVLIMSSGLPPLLDYGNLIVDGGAMLLNTSGAVLGFNDVSGGGRVDSSVQVRGDASPGDSVGRLTVTGDLGVADGAGLLWELGGSGAVAGVDYDTINVSGALTMDGDWMLKLLDAGGSANPGDMFYLFGGFTSQSGTIIPMVDPSMVDPARWDLSGLTFGTDQTGLYMTGLSVRPGGPIGDIPEPMTMLAVGLGLTALGGYIRRRRKI